jgi:galactokinase
MHSDDVHALSGSGCDQHDRYHLISNVFRSRFMADPTFVVRAPGRVDLMGSHTDYNLGHVLTMAINRDVWIAGRARADAAVHIYSMGLDDERGFEVQSLVSGAQDGWGNYVRGVAAVLAEEQLPLAGFDAVVHSTVPIGSGLSSSAALECAVAMAFQFTGGWTLEPARLARLCQRAEHEWAGVKCGILDQYTSCFGEADSVLALDCRTTTHRCWTIHPSLQVFICDTRSKRELAASQYTSRRAQCEEGARRLGVDALCEASLQELMRRQAAMPEEVFRRCRFILEEDGRVPTMAAALCSGDETRVRQLCLDSFRGARDLYEICAPSMYAMMDAMMNAPGVVGARQAGAGFGGCMVAIVRREESQAFAQNVSGGYRAATGICPEIYAVRGAHGASVISEFT